MHRKALSLSPKAWMCWGAIACLLLISGCGTSLTSSNLRFDDEPLQPTNTHDDLSIPLWPDGVIPYQFADGIAEPDLAVVQEADRNNIRDAINQWETITQGVIDFQECFVDRPDCPPRLDRLLIRYNGIGNDRNNAGCTIGKKRDSSDNEPPRLRMPPGTGMSTLLHELGHCIGLIHEHERQDRNRWLSNRHADWAPSRADLDEQPLLGNYDYDSIMHYCSTDSNWESGALRFADALGNQFCRGEQISPRDASRVIQYYAKLRFAKWGFFRSLSEGPEPGTDNLSNPFLAPNVSAVGSPAITYRDNANYDLFVRGSDNHLYWWNSIRAFGLLLVGGENHAGWQSLGCCIGSEPAAIATGDGGLDVAFIGANSGKLMRSHWNGSNWGPWNYVQGGFPEGGLKRDANGNTIGPALTSTGSGELDVFVVQNNGRLASSHLRNGTWSPWQTDVYDGNYLVAARPAAVALSDQTIQLAINNGGAWLFEPVVTMRAGAPVSFELGVVQRVIDLGSSPALTKRDNANSPYRVLVVTMNGWLAHRFADSNEWIPIGGLVLPGSGPAAVQSGPFGAFIAINGEDAVGCDATCQGGAMQGQFIQPGGLWLREFE